MDTKTACDILELNKNYSTLRGKEFNANNIFGIRKELGIETTVGKVKPEVAEKVKNINQFLAKEIKKAKSLFENNNSELISLEVDAYLINNKFDINNLNTLSSYPRGTRF